MVRDEEPLHLFGRMRGPPAHHADRHARRRGDVPDRRAPRASARRSASSGPVAGSTSWKSRTRCDVRTDAGRERRPDHRREDRHEGLQPRRVPLGGEALPVGHPALRREPVEQLPVEAVQAEPDDRRAAARRAPRALRGVRRVHRLRRRPRASPRAREADGFSAALPQDSAPRQTETRGEAGDRDPSARSRGPHVRRRRAALQQLERLDDGRLARREREGAAEEGDRVLLAPEAGPDERERVERLRGPAWAPRSGESVASARRQSFCLKSSSASARWIASLSGYSCARRARGPRAPAAPLAFTS